MGMAPDPARIDRLEQAGVHRVLFWLPQEGRAAVEQGFDRFAAVMEQFQAAG
jgi:hypothetical protein